MTTDRAERIVRVELTLDPDRSEMIQHRGVDEVNAVLAAGGRVVSLQGPNMITKEIGTGGGMVTLTFVGIGLNVTVEDMPCQS